MSCVGYNEEAFLKNLVRINGYKIQDGMLVLMVDGTEVSRWTRKKVIPAKILRA
jgi:heat shock protein HslJ